MPQTKMKNIVLKTSDVYDLAGVVASIVKDQSAKLEFKEILKLQKMANYFLDTIKTFSEEFSRISKEQSVFVENANVKISAYKQKLHKESDKNGEFDDKYKEKLDAYVDDMLAQVRTDITKEVNPEFEKLYSTEGSKEVSLELSEENHKLLVINFELFAKEKYTNKNKMIEVYETLTAA